LRRNNPLVIAEVKTESPFGFRSDRSWTELFAIALDVGDVVSVHVDPRWGGSLGFLRGARALTTRPLLAKGIHAADIDVRRALGAGAQWVLVVGRVPAPDLLPFCLLEPKSVAEAVEMPVTARLVWNARDIETGKRKQESYGDLRRALGPDRWICQASFIGSWGDVAPSASAILVGEYLPEFAKAWPRQRLKERS